MLEDELDVGRLQATLKRMAGTPPRLPPAATLFAARLPADGRNVPRETDQRDAERAHRANARPARKGGRRMRATIDLGGVPLELLPERALWRADAKALFVADLHLGKASAFRAFGAPAPTGASEETLRRLGALVDAVKPERLVVLGDFVHAAPSMTPGLTASLGAWRAERAELACAVVLGNHDVRAGRWIADLGFEVAEAPARLRRLRMPAFSARRRGCARRGPRRARRSCAPDDAALRPGPRLAAPALFRRLPAARSCCRRSASSPAAALFRAGRRRG